MIHIIYKKKKHHLSQDGLSKEEGCVSSIYEMVFWKDVI